MDQFTHSYFTTIHLATPFDLFDLVDPTTEGFTTLRWPGIAVSPPWAYPQVYLREGFQDFGSLENQYLWQ